MTSRAPRMAVGQWYLAGIGYGALEPGAPRSGFSATARTRVPLARFLPGWVWWRAVQYPTRPRPLPGSRKTRRTGWPRTRWVKCYMPGIPRATYLPFPFQIVQSPQHLIFAYEFASASRIVCVDRPDFEAPVYSWMGHSRARFEDDTLVIDVTDQVPDTWFDHAGNHHSEALQGDRALHPSQPRCVDLRGDTGRPEYLYSPLDDSYAPLSPPG